MSTGKTIRTTWNLTAKSMTLPLFFCISSFSKVFFMVAPMQLECSNLWLELLEWELWYPTLLISKLYWPKRVDFLRWTLVLHWGSLYSPPLGVTLQSSIGGLFKFTILQDKNQRVPLNKPLLSCVQNVHLRQTEQKIRTNSGTQKKKDKKMCQPINQSINQSIILKNRKKITVFRDEPCRGKKCAPGTAEVESALESKTILSWGEEETKKRAHHKCRGNDEKKTSVYSASQTYLAEDTRIFTMDTL